MNVRARTCNVPLNLRRLLTLLGWRVKIFRESLLQLSEPSRVCVAPALRSMSSLVLPLRVSLSRIGATAIGGRGGIRFNTESCATSGGASRSGGCGCRGAVCVASRSGGCRSRSDIRVTRGGCPGVRPLCRLRCSLSKSSSTGTLGPAFCLFQLVDRDV